MAITLLFNNGQLDDALKEQARKLVEEVEAAPEDHVLHVDEDQWREALVERWRVDAPQLQTDEVWMDPAQEIKVDVSRDWGRAISDPSRPFWYPGYRVTVHVPFSGDSQVFKLRASQFSFNPPRGDARAGELLDVIEYPHDAPVDIKARTNLLVESVEQHLSWSQQDIARFNLELSTTALSAISARRQRLRTNYEQLQATGLPMRRPGHEVAKTYIADAIIRRPAPVLPAMPPSIPVALEPVLADKVFEHILGIIRSAGRDMERSPKAYARMGEEDRRQMLLLALNTHYRGQAAAEAFNFTGKTDLLIRHEGQNLFIGECKVWSGPKGLLETIGQLFGYRAWRDTKLAIIMFVKAKDLTSIVAKARGALATHPNFIEWTTAATETELRCTVSWPGDNRRHADLAVSLIHTPDLEVGMSGRSDE